MFPIPKDGLLIVVMNWTLVIDGVFEEGDLAGVKERHALTLWVESHQNKIKIKEWFKYLTSDNNETIYPYFWTTLFLTISLKSNINKMK